MRTHVRPSAISPAAVTALLLGALLAGCAAPTATVPTATTAASGEEEPLPGPIHDERDVPASADRLPCDEARACVDHTFTLPRTAVMRATLAWILPGNQGVLNLYRDGEFVWNRGAHTGDHPQTKSLVFELTLPAGEYMLRVDPRQMAGDRYTLDVAFSERTPASRPGLAPPTFGPHVVIGVADTGINPYHELFYRPHLTEHPCTYIRAMPCSLEALPLSVGQDDWRAAVETDRAVWESVEPGKWYWIPQTAFIAVTCAEWTGATRQLNGEGFCILDDVDPHGAMVTSILALQNPDAYIAFHAGSNIGSSFADAGVPVDLYSVSIAAAVPYPVPAIVAENAGEATGCDEAAPPLFFQGAGNTVTGPVLSCSNGQSDKIVVGGGYTAPAYAVEAMSGDHPDVTSYYCPPVAPANLVHGLLSPGARCGTSFATPTVAGAASKVILELRRASGYDGGMTADGMVDPVLGVRAADVRAALMRTATYTPTPRYEEYLTTTAEPLNPAMPWLQWGWGFYDLDEVNATIAHLLGTTPAPEKPAEARAYMAALTETRRTLYG